MNGESFRESSGPTPVGPVGLPADLTVGGLDHVSGVRVSLDSDSESIRAALLDTTTSDARGATHNFYHYPARFSPAIARAVMEAFSAPGDVVLDPFMGGGTTIIEGLRLGRRMIGTDLNALAHFVADVRTTPLSAADEHLIREWAKESAKVFGEGARQSMVRVGVANLPGAVAMFVKGALTHSEWLPFRRQRAFARCALLRLGQWALDCRDFVAPRRRQLGEKLPDLVEEMFQGMRELVRDCQAAGVTKGQLRGSRTLLHRSAIGLDEDSRLLAMNVRPRLVFTSPPYPGVHVLYHRWQYRGRRETSAPYWIADVPDGYFESHYTGGSRTPTGQRRYFEMITGAFRSVRDAMDPAGLVVQLVGFSDTQLQLPTYLAAMEEAGFREWSTEALRGPRLARAVPNRKWYARLHGRIDASCELLLLHRPR